MNQQDKAKMFARPPTLKDLLKNPAPMSVRESRVQRFIEISDDIGFAIEQESITFTTTTFTDEQTNITHSGVIFIAHKPIKKPETISESPVERGVAYAIWLPGTASIPVRAEHPCPNAAETREVISHVIQTAAAALVERIEALGAKGFEPPLSYAGSITVPAYTTLDAPRVTALINHAFTAMMPLVESFDERTAAVGTMVEAIRQQRLSVGQQFSPPDVTDVLGSPVRTDVLLRFGAADQQRRSAEVESVTELMSVGGYVELVLADNPTGEARPWMEPENTYAPRFVITSINHPITGVPNVMFTLMGIQMVKEFMQRGDWVRTFWASGDRDITKLVTADSMVFSTEHERVLHTLKQIIVPGFLVSIDLPYNETMTFDIPHHGAQNSDDYARHLGEVINNFAQRDAVQSGDAYDIFRPTGVRISIGDVEHGHVCTDSRYFDSLFIRNSSSDNSDMAKAFEDSFFTSSNGTTMNGVHINDRSHPQNRRTLLGQLGINFIENNVVQRVDVTKRGLELISEMFAYSGLRVAVSSHSQKRPSVTPYQF